MPNALQLLSQITSPVHIVKNTYDSSRNLLTVKTNKWKNKANTLAISAYAYTVNNLGQRTSVTTSGEVYATAPADCVWSYDSLGQVVTANDNHYTYDQIGNRTIIQKGTEQPVTYTPNSLNQYASIGNITPTYDPDGNQLSGLQPTITQPERNQLTFTYNAQNRPIQVNQNSTVKESYTYDRQGRRIQKGDTLTLYDGYNAIAEYNLNTRTLKTTYAWGNDLSGTLQGAGGVGGLLSATDYTTQTPFITYPTYDGNGNITEYPTEENSGSVAAHYEYDAFGNVVKKTGDKEYRYQFSTKPCNDATGILYYNYRDYDAVCGQWAGRDPIGENGCLKLYGFVHNNAVNSFDILGMEGVTNTVGYIISPLLAFGSNTWTVMNVDASSSNIKDAKLMGNIVTDGDCDCSSGSPQIYGIDDYFDDAAVQGTTKVLLKSGREERVGFSTVWIWDEIDITYSIKLKAKPSTPADRDTSEKCRLVLKTRHQIEVTINYGGITFTGRVNAPDTSLTCSCPNGD